MTTNTGIAGEVLRVGEMVLTDNTTPTSEALGRMGNYRYNLAKLKFKRKLELVSVVI